MVDKQNRARDLRACGWTLSEICEEVGCSRSSASLWCRDVTIDEVVLERRRRERFLAGNKGARQRGPNKLQRRKAAEIAETLAAGREVIGCLTPRDRLICGLALYASEGSKTEGAVVFANSDPRLVHYFVGWLREHFDVTDSRLRIRLYLHEGLDLAAAIQFWSELTAIPASQFTKPYRAAADPSLRRSKHPMGCPSVIYSCSRTHRRVMGMIDALLSFRGSEAG